MEGRLRHLVTILAPCAGASVLLATGLGAAGATACASPSVDAPPAQQKAAIVCLVNELRQGKDLRALRPSAGLERAARLKARAIVRCEHFSHTPCGRAFASTFIDAGYAVGSWTVGENLAWGAGDRGSAGASLRGAARLGVAQGELPAPRLEGHRHLPVAGNALRARSGGSLGDRLREPLLVLLRQAPRDQLHDGGRFSRKARRPS